MINVYLYVEHFIPPTEINSRFLHEVTLAHVFQWALNASYKFTIIQIRTILAHMYRMGETDGQSCKQVLNSDTGSKIGTQNALFCGGDRYFSRCTTYSPSEPGTRL